MLYKKNVLTICDLSFLIILHKKWTILLVSLEYLVTFSRVFLFRLLFSCLHILKIIKYWFCLTFKAHGRESQADTITFCCPQLYRRLFQDYGLFKMSHKQQGNDCTKSFSESNFKISLSTQNTVRLWHWKYGRSKMDFKSSWRTHKKPFFNGFWVHNQHIKRLWLEVWVYVLQQLTL